MVHQRLSFSKIEAAGRQLETAIWLFLSDGDFVSIHTLVMASFGILKGIAKSRSDGFHQGFQDEIKKMIRPEREKWFWREFNKASNYFKHADRDAEGDLVEVRWDNNDHVILMACIYYNNLTGISLLASQAFCCWYSITYPEVVYQDGRFDMMKADSKVDFERLTKSWTEMSRVEQFKIVRDYVGYAQ